jgi:transglutaminase-like putative cysteine protease
VALAVDDAPARAEDRPTLDQIAADAEMRAAALPQSEWDIPYLADTLDYDYLRAFAFVRDSIAFDPYRGVLRGAEGTLAARAGNAYDRALLLCALLDGMQVAYRFAFADLDDATVGRLLARSMQPAASPLPQPGIDLTPMFDPTALETRASRDYARLRSVVGDQIDTIGSDHPTDLASAVRHHVWIQVASGSQWVDLDPSMPDAVAGTPLAIAVSVASTIPPEDHQVVTLTMTARSFQDGTPFDQVVLDVTLDAADAASRKIFLYFSPDVSGLGGTILETLSGDVSWRPVLTIDGETSEGTAFRAGGTGTDVFGNPTGAPDLVSLL